MIAAVIVTYNRVELLKECISAVKQQSCQCDILVIDNASTDMTGEYMQELSSKDNCVMYYRLENNIGGAGGFNYGIKKAIQLNYDYVWIMDDDTIPDSTCLQSLMEADSVLQGPLNYGYLSSAVFWIDGSECKMNRQKISKQYFNQLHYLSDGLILTDQATFVSLLVPKETIMKVGLPIKEYFIWGDDIEYTRRIAVRYQLPSYLVGKSVVIHKMSNNEGSSISKDSMDRIQRYNYAFRNDNSTYRREGLKGFGYYFGKCCINILRVLLYASDHRTKRVLIILKNFFVGLAFNPQIETITKEVEYE